MARRARTTGKPKKRTKSRLKKDTQFNEDQDTPSEARWATMTSYGSFVGEYLSLQCSFSILNGGVTCNKSTTLMERNTHLARKIGMFSVCGFFNVCAVMKSLHGSLRWFSAMIVPTGRDPQKDSELWEYWVGKITDIRAIVHDENSNNVHVSPSFSYTLHSNLVLPT